VVSVTVVDQPIDVAPAHEFAPLLHQPQLQHFRLYLDVITTVGLRAGDCFRSRRRYLR